MNESVEKLEARLKKLSAGDPQSTERIDALNDLAWELGLTQTKRALEKVASRVGEGTIFHIRLPIRQKGRA